MPLITASEAPLFENDHATFVGLAAPSRGSTENCAWRLTIKPGTAAPPHSLDREEIFVALSGTLTVTMDGAVMGVAPGDALVVPAHQQFAMANHGTEPFEAVVVLPVGGRGIIEGREPFVPPWAQ